MSAKPSKTAPLPAPSRSMEGNVAARRSSVPDLEQGLHDPNPQRRWQARREATRRSELLKTNDPVQSSAILRRLEKTPDVRWAERYSDTLQLLAGLLLSVCVWNALTLTAPGAALMDRLPVERSYAHLGELVTALISCSAGLLLLAYLKRNR